MSFSLFSSLTLNREYPAGVSNKSSMFLLLAAVLSCSSFDARFSNKVEADRESNFFSLKRREKTNRSQNPKLNTIP